MPIRDTGIGLNARALVQNISKYISAFCTLSPFQNYLHKIKMASAILQVKFHCVIWPPYMIGTPVEYHPKTVAPKMSVAE
jgi:hypothetical protein